MDAEIKEEIDKQNKIEEIITKQFEIINENIFLNKDRITGGSTAIIAIIYYGILYLCNVGDSKGILFQKNLIPINVDNITFIETEYHNMKNKKEIERTKEAYQKYFAHQIMETNIFQKERIRQPTSNILKKKVTLEEIPERAPTKIFMNAIKTEIQMRVGGLQMTKSFGDFQKNLNVHPNSQNI